MSSTMSSYATLVVFMSLVALTMTSVQSGRRSDWHKHFQPYSSTSWGEWGDWEYCPEGTYAFAFQQKSESYRQWGDNSANNAIKLYCKGPSDRYSSASITSAQQKWGDWQEVSRCPDGMYLHGAILRSEPKQGSWDDAAVTNIDMTCKKPNTNESSVRVSGHGNTWGNWGTGIAACNAFMAYSFVCAIQTRIEANRGSGDDSALNSVRFGCCKMVKW